MNWSYEKISVRNFIGINNSHLIRIGYAVYLCSVLLGAGIASAQDNSEADELTHNRRNGIYFGLGTLSSGNYEEDMKNFLSYQSDEVRGTGNWLVLSIAYTQHLFSGLYLVPEATWSVSRIKTTLEGFEYASNEKVVDFLQYGGGLRYYIFETN